MVVYGGRRSAKSFSVSQLLVRKACEYPRRIGVLRKFAITMRLSVWERVKSAIEETGIALRDCDINKSDRSITLPNGSSFHFFGADDPQKMKSLEGFTDFWLEEANEFEEIDLDTLDAGLSADVDPPPQIWLTFNPIPSVEGFVPWLVSRFISKVPSVLSEPQINDNICVLRTWYKDNPFCPEATKKLLNSYKDTNPSLFKMWALGEFTYLEGVILKNWDVVDSVPEGMNLIGYGLDFGFADDPLAVIKVWQSHEEMWLEQMVYSTGLTNQQASEAMEERGMRKGEDHIMADAAEPKSIKELRTEGWIVTPCDKAPDYKRAAINYLKSFRIHVTRASTDLIRELSVWSWKKDKLSGRFMPIPVDGNDHGIDATIYRVFTRSAAWGVMR
jgi:phage terminase large subunit